MMKDCHFIFSYLTEWRNENNFTGPMIVMGRSLGSASALELVDNYKEKIDGIILESGFAYQAGHRICAAGQNLLLIMFLDIRWRTGK